MQIVLFAIIGASIKAGVAYWICYAMLCAWKVGRAIAIICSD